MTLLQLLQRRADGRLGFEEVLEAARVALDRGPVMDDLFVLVIAAARGMMHLQDFTKICRRLPAGTPAEETPELFRDAQALRAARIRDFKLSALTMDETRVRDAAREKAIADEVQRSLRATPSWVAESRSKVGLEARARQVVLDREADEKRIAAADVAALEQQFEDELRLVAAGARRNGR